MPQFVVDTVTLWVNGHLLPHNFLWLNYHRVYVSGMDVRTTLFGKVLHWSMKSSVNGVRPSMIMSNTANTMMNNAQPKGKWLARKNTINISSTLLW